MSLNSLNKTSESQQGCQLRGLPCAGLRAYRRGDGGEDGDDDVNHPFPCCLVHGSPPSPLRIVAALCLRSNLLPGAEQRVEPLVAQTAAELLDVLPALLLHDRLVDDAVALDALLRSGVVFVGLRPLRAVDGDLERTQVGDGHSLRLLHERLHGGAQLGEHGQHVGSLHGAACLHGVGNLFDANVAYPDGLQEPLAVDAALCVLDLILLINQCHSCKILVVVLVVVGTAAAPRRSSMKAMQRYKKIETFAIAIYRF